MRVYARHVRFLTLLFLLFLPVVSPARDVGIQGFNIQRFTPQFDGYGLYNIYGSGVLPNLEYSFGVYANFSRNVANIIMPARGTDLSAVSDNATLDFGAALGILNFMEAGFVFPVVVYQDGYNYDDLQKYKTAAIGDVRFDIKFRMLKDKKKSVGFAFLSRTGFPTGNRSAFTGDNGFTWEGSLILDKTWKHVSFYANAGYKFMKSTKVLATTFGDSLTFGGGAKVPIGLSGWSLLAEVDGIADMKNRSKIATPIEVLGGVRKELTSGVELDLGGARGVTSALGSPTFRVFSGVSFNSAKRHEHMRHVETLPVSVHTTVHTTVHFNFDSYKLSASARSSLDYVSHVLFADKKLCVLISGHTDNIGSRKYNHVLSCRRAEAVRRYLLSSGADSGQLEVRCYGKDIPAESNSTLEGRAHNRRVEIDNVEVH